MRRGLGLAAVLALAVVACHNPDDDLAAFCTNNPVRCGQDAGPGEPDGGGFAGGTGNPDSGSDAGLDSGIVGPDAGLDSGIVGPDAGPDSGFAVPDGGVELGATASIGAGREPTLVFSGTTAVVGFTDAGLSWLTPLDVSTLNPSSAAIGGTPQTSSRFVLAPVETAASGFAFAYASHQGDLPYLSTRQGTPNTGVEVSGAVVPGAPLGGIRSFAVIGVTGRVFAVYAGTDGGFSLRWTKLVGTTVTSGAVQPDLAFAAYSQPSLATADSTGVADAPVGFAFVRSVFGTPSIEFSPLDTSADGVLSPPVVIATNALHPKVASLSPSGDFVVAWSTNTEVFVGRPDGGMLNLGPGSSFTEHSIASDPGRRRAIVAFETDAGVIALVQVKDGAAGPRIMGPAGARPSVAWRPGTEQFGLVWEYGGQLYSAPVLLR